MFEDRQDAGRRLAERLTAFGDDRPVIVALPRGGVPVAYEVARHLGAPLDVLIVRKIGFPDQPEVALGAVANGGAPEIVMNDEFVEGRDFPTGYVQREVQSKLDEIGRMERLFRRHRSPVPVSGRTVIVIDDGAATGATLRVAVRRLRRGGPTRILVALPVASQQAAELLSEEADGVVCLDVSRGFVAVGDFYRDFSEVPAEEVARFLDLALPRASSTASSSDRT